MWKMHKGKIGLALTALLLLLLIGGASALLDVNLTDDYSNDSYTGGSIVQLTYNIRDFNDQITGTRDLNCAIYYPTSAGGRTNKYDGNFTPGTSFGCVDSNLLDTTACTTQTILPNITADVIPTIACDDNSNGSDINYTSGVIHVQKSCAVDWMPLITAMIIAGILLVVAGFVATSIGNPTFSFILIMVAVATIVITLVPTLNCAI